MPRPPIERLGERGFAEKYGVSARWIRRFGVLRFSEMNEARRELMVNLHKNALSRSRKRGKAG